MGIHTLNLAKHKIRAAQEHLKAALEALKEEKAAPFAEHLDAASTELETAKELFK